MEEESVMKASPGEEGRIIAQSRFDVNEEIAAPEKSADGQRRASGGFTLGLFRISCE
jgi:hypothetical protein